jgi:hypothetical protein
MPMLLTAFLAFFAVCVLGAGCMVVAWWDESPSLALTSGMMYGGGLGCLFVLGLAILT